MAIVIRKKFNSLLPAEKLRFVNAVKRIKSHDINVGGGTVSTTGGTYQKYITWHLNNAEHRTASFLPWHRAMLWEFEKDLILADKQLGNDGNIGIPYWRWQNFNGLPGTTRGILWKDDFLGGTGNPVTTGPFKESDWKLFPGGINGLVRELGSNIGYLASLDQLLAIQGISTFDVTPFDEQLSTGSNPVRTNSYTNALEGWVYGGPGAQPGTWQVGAHNCAHVWVGGSMLPMSSPNDPVFFLNHANVDRLWAEWQFSNPGLADQYPSDADITAAGQTGGLPRKRGDLMLPWDGSSGTLTWTVEDTLNFKLMGDVHPVSVPLAPEHNYNYDSMITRTLSFT